MTEIFRDARLAAVQAAPVFLDRAATVEKARALVEEAAAAGADVIGFPENFVSGFPEWFNFYLFGSPVARRLGRQTFESALEVGSAAAEAIADVARKTRTHVVIGANERNPGTLGTLYNSQFFFGPDGTLLGVHRKLVPTVFERMVHAPGDGSGLRTYPTEFGAIGGLICGEHSGSLARFVLLAQQERIHVASWPAFSEPVYRDSIDLRSRYHAFEGKVFIINAAGVLDDRMLQEMELTDEQIASLPLRGGGSSIIAPNGQYLSGPADDTEQILYADTDFDSVIEAKQMHDLTGHYNRYDLFTLDVTPASAEVLGPSLTARIAAERERGAEATAAGTAGSEGHS